MLLKTVDDQLVGDAIRLRDRLNVVGARLLLDVQRLLVLRQDRCTRAAGKINRDLQFSVVQRASLLLAPIRVHPCPSVAKDLAASRTTANVSSRSAFVVRKFVMHARS